MRRFTVVENRCLFLLIIGLMAVVFLGGYAYAGVLDSTAVPSDDSTRMYTVENIYDYLTDVDNAPPSKPTGGFGEPAAGPAATMQTLDSVFENLTRVPATGQTTCYKYTTVWETDTDCASTEGQDGEYKKGAALRYHTYTDTNVVVVDENTGLEWEQKTVGNKDTLYKWYDDTKTGDEMYAAAYYCEHQIGTSGTYAGHADWRLPNAKELQSIVDYGIYNPSINTTYFPNTVSSYYWASTTNANVTGSAWDVHFLYGLVYYNVKTNNYYVRCVRGGQ